jgi:methionine biosynthesis protein MetW
VLDVGCGDGALLRLLAEEKRVDARGMELSQRGVNDCVAKGLSVIQGDADVDLVDYPTDAFDYVILSQTIQATRQPRRVLENMLRVGRRAIVSFPNFGHWRIRAQVALRGRMPVTENLSYAWYDTPNIHFCTIRDFVALVDDVGRDDRARGRARSLWRSRCASRRPGRSGTCSASRRCSCSSARNRDQPFALAALARSMASTRVAPAEQLDPLAGLEILVVHKEVLDLLPGDVRQVGVVLARWRSAWSAWRTAPR